MFSDWKSEAFDEIFIRQNEWKRKRENRWGGLFENFRKKIKCFFSKPINFQDYTAHFSNNTAVFENGVLYCKSNVKVSGSSENSNVFKFDPSTQYHLLLANGKTTAKGLGYHKDQSSVSRKLRLSEVTDFCWKFWFYFQIKNIYLKTFGVLYFEKKV